MTNENIVRFETLLKEVNREGTDDLLKFIRSSDFYVAPASTRFHSCHKGGLLEHSLKVCDCLLEKMDQPVWKEKLGEVGRESLILTSLLHDMCKTFFYTVEYRNKKINGVWESVECYTIDDKFPYGHGEKSVMMIEQYIELKPVERYMIRWHMGFSESKDVYNSLGNAIKKYPQIVAINEADLEATYLLEKEE